VTRGQSYPRAEIVDWLLDPSNPSVRYLTLVNLLNKKQTDREVERARAEIMLSGVVPRILAKQEDGSWNSPGRSYRDKYKGTVWQLIVLAEHEADGAHKQVRGACEYVLQHCQDPDSFAFSHTERSGSPGGRHSDVIPCLTGNMIWSLVKLGYLEDGRVKKAIRWISEYQRFDDGGGKPSGWPYDRYEMCWGRHSCHMGVVKSLKALSAIPKAQRSRKTNEAVAEACEYLLAHRIYRQSHHLTKTSKPGWLKLQFPLMYQTDILEITGILADLGVRDRRMQDAIEVIAAKQNQDGTWSLESTFNGRFQVDFEEKGRPSRWITYRALRVLKMYYES
jgi:hypothetical protein